MHCPRTLPADYKAKIDHDGFSVVEDVVSGAVVEHLRKAIAQLPQGDEVRQKRGVYGVRNLLAVCEPVRQLAAFPEVRRLVAPVLGERAFAVRATFFDKVEGANWKLRWHQDAVIAVRERHEVPGYLAWSEKAGVWHVRPPHGVLASMLAVRIHLDPCHALNGPLRVLAGSHQELWTSHDLEQCKSSFDEVTCEVGERGAVVMRPLTLHCSSPAEVASHRRVIHLEYASAPLPPPLEWHMQVTDR